MYTDVVKTEKLMTTKELAKALGVDVKTIQRVVSSLEMNVERVGSSHTMIFTEAQATAIKVELQNHSKVANEKWYTAKEICELCGVGKSTFSKYTSSVDVTRDSKVVNTGKRHNVRTAVYTENVLKQFQSWLMNNQAKQGRSSTEVKVSVEHGIEDTPFLYDKESICIICDVDVRTFEKFAPTSIADRDFIKKGSSHKAFYTENVLKQFQAWLMHNQVTQGKSSKPIKQAVQEAVVKDLVMTEIISSGNTEAFEQLVEHYRNEMIQTQKVKQLEAENKQLNHALEYDKVIGWKPWNSLKKEFGFQHREKFDNIAETIGLVEGEDYDRKVMGMEKFPILLISPTGIDKLTDWLDS